MAPTPVDFAIFPGAAVRDPAVYGAFWSRAQQAHDASSRHGGQGGHVDAATPRLVFRHRSDGTTSMPHSRYASIAQDSLDLPIEVISLQLTPDAIRTLLAGLPGPDLWLGDHLTAVSCDVLDHGIMLVECTVTVSGTLDEVPGVADLPARVHALEPAVVALVEQVAAHAATAWIEPMLVALRDLPGAAGVIAPPLRATSGSRPRAGTGLPARPGRARAGRRNEVAAQPTAMDIGPPMGQALWVARQLCVPRPRISAGRDDPVDVAVRHWLEEVPSADADGHVGALATRRIDHVTRWLNYVVVDDDATGLGNSNGGSGDIDEQVWRALRLAQYFYAAMDAVDSRLAGILAQAMVGDDAWELRQLRRSLEQTARRASLIQMQQREVTKFLQRGVRLELVAILGHWSFDELVAQPVREKVALCRQRIEEMEEERANRSKLYTDLILLGIGITSVLSTVIGIAQFGRAIATDPSFSGSDVGRGDVVGWFAAQPADALLVLSAGVSVLLVVLYLYLRRSHD